MPTTRLRLAAATGLLGLGLLAPPLRAQESLLRTVTVCTSDVFVACVEVTLRAGPTLFELGIRNLGLTVLDEPPSAFYNLVLATGGTAAVEPVARLVTPTGLGGAVVSDGSPWEVFDTGDLLFVSALTNRGVGGCVAGADVDGFGQAVNTCGSGSFARFQFPTLSSFRVQDVEVLSLEFALLEEPLGAASCGFDPCVITADRLENLAEVPEPEAMILLATGILTLAVARKLRGRGGRTA